MDLPNQPDASSAATGSARRSSGSFVIRLTLGQSMRMLKLLLAVDVMVVVMYVGLVFVDLEHTVAGLADLRPAAAEQSARFVPGVRVTVEEEAGYGWYLHYKLEEALGLPSGAVRSFVFEPTPDSVLVGGWAVRPVYTVTAPRDEGKYLRAVFDLSERFRWFCHAMAIVLVMELLMLISNTAGVSRAVRQTLAPIHQLAAATRNITAGTGSSSGEKLSKRHDKKNEKHSDEKQQELKLSGTIDTLNKITAQDLGARIPIEGERRELRGLAAAINGMLDRLDAAYSTQLRFVSDASHELRTPIAVLQGYANMLDRWGKDDPAVLQESIEAIKGEAEGMKVLVEQLLFLARGDNDTIVMQVQPIELSDCAAEVLRDTRLIDQKHELVSDMDGVLWVEGDGGLIKQALRIFVDNAVKYSPTGGRIAIRGTMADGWVRISVTDNGIGIPEKDLPHVFERFYRSDESRARSTGGTGLGLSIAQWIIQRHGGHVEILSRQEIGTRLTMVLPVGEPPLSDTN